jgi:hypothetical protein
MSIDYIPASDADFDAWQQNLVDYVVANATALSIPAADVSSIQGFNSTWDAKYSGATAAAAAANAATQGKNDCRDDFVAFLRAFVARVQANSRVTDEHRQMMGLTVRAVTRTQVGAPTSKPVATVDTSQRLRHTINFVDELTPTSRAKPDGVQGCEIWMKVGDPAPAGPDDVRYLALDTSTPYMVVFDAADASKTAYYMLRWMSTRGETGPWSATVSGTITN